LLKQKPCQISLEPSGSFDDFFLTSVDKVVGLVARSVLLAIGEHLLGIIDVVEGPLETTTSVRVDTTQAHFSLVSLREFVVIHDAVATDAFLVRFHKISPLSAVEIVKTLVVGTLCQLVEVLADRVDVNQGKVIGGLIPAAVEEQILNVSMSDITIVVVKLIEVVLEVLDELLGLAVRETVSYRKSHHSTSFN